MGRRQWLCWGTLGALGVGAILSPSPDTRAAPHTPPHAPPRAAHGAASASQQALDKAIADRKSLIDRQARQTALIDSQRREQTRAAQEAAAQALKARHYSALTTRAETELQATQKQIDALILEIAELTRRQTAQRLALARRRAALQTILPVALRVARYPGASVVALTGQASESVQGLAVIAGLTRLTSRQAEDLRGQKILLDQTAVILAERNASLGRARDTLAHLRDVNADKMDDATHLQAQAQERARQAHDEIAAATATAATLDDALTAIDRTQARIRARMEAEAKELAHRNQRAKASALNAQAATMSGSGGAGPTRSSGHAPVAGRVLTVWHQTTESGPASGITYQAPGGSTVSAPCAGQIDFAGPFRSFGNMIILDCGRHYRFVLSGLGQMTVSTGQVIARHAPLGAMSAGGGSLFVQLRAGSRTVDPGPYL